MVTNKGSLETSVSIGKDIVSTLRDSVLFILFLLLLFSPDMMREQLSKAGFTEGSFGGLMWRAQAETVAEQTKDIGQTVEKATENYDDLIEHLHELEKNVTDPGLKLQVKNMGEIAEASRAELTKADQTLKSSLATQQQFVAKIAPSAVVNSGWMFLGRVTENKTAWAPGSPQTVDPVPAPIEQGAKLKIRTDAYLRADGPSNSRASAPITGVAKEKQVVQVLDVDYSHAKGGGWFVWAKVSSAY
ncbi:hypothetical protein [Nitrosospira sp. Is2]|uniref:hypothetical protein n=1 Tax=Nitrosospira sp. Is2 TaxID=3080532 RepID=UPI0029550986|nr:hypothetical protein [Nitrosospira sp. Is2]WON73523.1 hypothetical protein R5L00_13735 [Nitrosospira sp. Is2]